MSIPEALKGIKSEFERISNIDRFKRGLIYSRILAAEIFGTIKIIPYGVRALNLHKSLPEAKLDAQTRPDGVSIVRSVKYGDEDRNTIDLYLPPPTESPSPSIPTVLFVHGGIWATGDSWNYAPLATRLAQAGILTAVMQYTLYPQALAPEMAAEVSRALTWTFDNISKMGGNSQNITLVGHSAGAQLCAMALLHRAAATPTTKLKPEDDASFVDTRMPKRLVGMAGVYDIEKHFEYEQARDVHELSTMARAVGGSSCFAANSPSIILKAAAHGGKISGRNLPSLSASQSSSPFKGDLIASRIGLNRAQSNNSNISKSSLPYCDFLQISVDQARCLPPTILQASTSDVTVPWYESADMHWALYDCGVPVKSLIYNRVGHGDFVVNFRPLPSTHRVHSDGDLPSYGADLVKILRDEVPVDYSSCSSLQR